MKKVTMEDLPKYGIISVTSEADGISIRTLFKVNEEAWEYVCEFFGIVATPHPFTTGGFSSIMLPWDHMDKVLLYAVMRKENAVEALFIPRQYQSETKVYVPEGEYDAKYVETVSRIANSDMLYRVVRKSGNAVHGFRNVHFFSGLEW